ncbi:MULTISPECIES: hypothetical protein [Pseudonocardia]|uniref:Uncharacterized protein n=1 Tax=Pseudonocardia autotrophica TaxID=2074 RepID=A0A1Y2MLG1_PSEAH|nr:MULTISPECIES: hypothetical protein [Pseudonocardia]OSY35298.1 hypothetical protein BG845_06164 [Pseudonocardia autotrophica]TDN73263.1 hypothetical protein C8E95_2354 [Pseudonocardia autotrophica]BBG03999.1 hypothetical protein Pdca_52080 [Pseudonocardia autotrophica]
MEIERAGISDKPAPVAALPRHRAGVDELVVVVRGDRIDPFSQIGFR